MLKIYDAFVSHLNMHRFFPLFFSVR